MSRLTFSDHLTLPVPIASEAVQEAREMYGLTIVGVWMILIVSVGWWRAKVARVFKENAEAGGRSRSTAMNSNHCHVATHSLCR